MHWLVREKLAGKELELASEYQKYVNGGWWPEENVRWR
jgi:hypothetical protein